MKKRWLSVLMGIMVASIVLTGCGSKGDSMRAATADAACAESAVNASYEDEAYSYDMAATECAEEVWDADDYSTNSISGAASAASAAGYKSDDMSAESTSDVVSTSSSSSTDILAEDKLVYTADLTIETLDFDQTYSHLNDLIRSYGGRIESENYDAQYRSYTSNDRYRSGYHTTRIDYITIRIPSEHYNEFMSADSSLGNVTYKTQSLSNISQQYYSSTTRIELLEGQKEYYQHQLELIEQELMDCKDYEYVIDQMVDLEDRIISVQNEINSLRGSVKTMDMQVAYSTITLQLEEVKEYTDTTPVVEEEDDTFLTRLKNNLKGSAEAILSFLEGLLTIIIYILPFAVVFGIFALIIIAIIKAIINKTKKNKAKKDNAYANRVDASAAANVAEATTNATEIKTSEGADVQ